MSNFEKDGEVLAAQFREEQKQFFDACQEILRKDGQMPRRKKSWKCWLGMHIWRFRSANPTENDRRMICIDCGTKVSGR